nr:hypothetical protein [Tanacetum cinerariifolium]
MKAITTRSGVAYEGPSIPTPKKIVERETEETTDKEKSNFQGTVEESCVTCGGNHAYYNCPNTDRNQPNVCVATERETEETTDKEKSNFQGSTSHIRPPVTPISEPDVPKTLPKPNIPFHSRLNDQKLHEKATNQIEKFF